MADIRIGFHTNDGSGYLTFRPPTPKEVRRFLKAAYPVVDGQLQDRSRAARIALFDRLLKSVEDIETPDGEIVTAETKHLIPDDRKNEMIYLMIEDEKGQDVLRRIRK